VGELAESLTEMSRGLKERDFIRDTFGRYLTKEVVSSILESKDGLKLGGEQREISVMMSDLRGFTALTSNMPPEDVIKFLNRYLGSMIEILIEYRGTIDEIIGDGILAFFGAPQDLDDHPSRAVACALRMQNAMEHINALNEADGLPHLEMGVAINTGSVVVGNIGSEKRSKYGAVGAQVNFTGRMESFTTGGQVLVSQSTYEKLAGKLDIKAELSVEMKGVVGKVNLYEVTGINGPHEVKLSNKCYKFKDLDNPLGVSFYGMDSKIIDENMRQGALVQLSPTSAVMKTSDDVGQWEDLRMNLSGPEYEGFGEMYGKVISIDETDGLRLAMIRFTSVAPQIYKAFREALG
jgi:class 3 adenylate cyclase